MKVEIDIPDKLFRILEESGKIELLEEWALDGIESRLEVCSVGELIEE